MAYRQPGVRLTQEFQNLAPGLALFSLKHVHIGPAFQVVKADHVGNYNALQVSVSYLSKIDGAIVDTRQPTGDLLDYPVTVSLSDMIVTWKATASTGSVGAGDLRVLTDSVAGSLSTVQPGDKIVVTAPAAAAGTYTVTQKIDNQTVKFDIPFPAAAPSVTYKITRKIAGPMVIPESTIGLVIDEDQVTIPASLNYYDAETMSSYPIETAKILLKYRALRFEFSNSLKEFASVSELQSYFGIDQIVPQNPVVYAAYIALQNSVTPTSILMLGQEYLTQNDEVLAHTKAIEVLKNVEVYSLNPLTQDPAVHMLYKSHVIGMSTPEIKKWRSVVINRKLKNVQLVIDNATTGVGTSSIVPASTNGTVSATSLDTLGTPVSGGFSAVKVGDTVTVTGGTNATNGTYEVINKISNTSIKLNAPIATGASTDINFSIVRKDGVTPDGLEINDTAATFISSGATPGMYVRITNQGTGATVGRYKIASVPLQTRIILSEPIPVTGTSVVLNVGYEIDRDMTKAEQAAFIKSYAQSIGSRRVVVTWPDQFKVVQENKLVTVPGYFLNAIVGALTTGLPTQQGFTNLGVASVAEVVHSSFYFNEDELNTIADGGVMIFAQDVLGESQTYIRHQLTSDRSTIKFQEYSVTKNVDFISYFIAKASARFIGQYNVYDGLFDDLRVNAQSIISFLKDRTRVPKFGGVILAGSLSKLETDPNQIDTVIQKYNMTIPIPLNYLDITLVV